MDNVFRVFSIIALVGVGYMTLKVSDLSEQIQDISLSKKFSPETKNHDFSQVKQNSDTLKKINFKISELELQQSNSKQVASSEYKAEIVRMIDARVAEKIDENKVKASTAADMNSKVVKEVPPKTLEEIAERLEIDENTLLRIKDINKEIKDASFNMFKNDDETIDQFKERMKDIEEDEIKQAEFIGVIMQKMISNGAMSKIMKLQATQKQQVKELLGDKYDKYETMKRQLPHKDEFFGFSTSR